MVCLRKPSCGLPQRTQISSLQISQMKNVVRETLHALIPTPGTDESNGPVPNKTMETHSETKMPLPHHAITLSMCCRIWRGTPWSAMGYGQRHVEVNRVNFVRLPFPDCENRRKR